MQTQIAISVKLYVIMDKHANNFVYVLNTL